MLQEKKEMFTFIAKEEGCYSIASNWVWKKPDLPPFWNKELTGQTRLISLWQCKTWPFSLAAVFEYKLNFDWAYLIFAAPSLTLEVFHALIDLSFPVVYAIVGVPGSQKGYKFRANNR